uniref:Putative secreted protein n=1 Tax=Ixodes ricinus TaxID=34613 RepID=V5H7P7_IXORI
MFKLSSFLVVFVLAGLCFGASSEDDSSSGKGASTGAGGGDTSEASGGGAPSEMRRNRTLSKPSLAKLLKKSHSMETTQLSPHKPTRNKKQ